MKTLQSNAMKSGAVKLTREEMRKVTGGTKSVPCYCGEERTRDVECDSPADCACQCAELCGVQC